MTRRILQEGGTSFIVHSYKCEQRERERENFLFKGITLRNHLSAAYRYVSQVYVQVGLRPLCYLCYKIVSKASELMIMMKS